jgi:hypothetical protein
MDPAGRDPDPDSNLEQSAPEPEAWHDAAESLDDASIASPRPSDVSVNTVSPEDQAIRPYWRSPTENQARWSYRSIDSRNGPIRLEDHTEEGSEQSKACWAKHVSVDDYVIVSGSAPGVGSYVVWNCTVETLSVRCSKFHAPRDC